MLVSPQANFWQVCRVVLPGAQLFNQCKGATHYGGIQRAKTSVCPA